MGSWTKFWESFGPGLIAGFLIILWDVARMYIQSKWLIKKLHNKNNAETNLEQKLDTIMDKLNSKNL